MPYIPNENRETLRLRSGKRASNAGELNYQFTQLVRTYLLTHGASYSTMNDVLGAFEGAKLEFYARVVRPYEDIKRRENGDVY